MNCPGCGARNAEDAAWCSQCYRPFQAEVERPGPAGPPPPPGSTSRPPGPSPGPPPPPGSTSRPPARPAWRCPLCERSNPAEESRCAACGTSIFEAFGAGEDRPDVSPGAAAGWSLVFPGLGHGKVGQGLLGAAIGLLTVTTLVFGLVLGFGPGAGGMASLLLLVVVGLWAVAALDAYRWARGERDEILLRPRVISVLAGLVLFVFLFGVGQGIQP